MLVPASRVSITCSKTYDFINRFATSGDYASLTLIKDCSELSSSLVVLIQASLPHESAASLMVQLRKTG